MLQKDKKSPWMIFLILLMIFSLIFFVTSCGLGEDKTEEDNGQIEDDSDEEQEPDEDMPSEADEDEISPDEESMTEEDIVSLLSELDEPDEYYYEQTITAEEYGDSSQKFWFKDGRMKIEGEEEGTPYIIIWTEEYLYNLDPESKTAVRSVNKEDVEIDNNFENTLEVESENQRNLSYLGKETVNGEPCYIIEAIYTENNTVNKLWLHENYGIIMRAEIIDSNGEIDAVTEVTNLKIGDVSDEEFLIPEDYEFSNY